MAVLTLSLDELNIGDANVVFKETDDRERYVIEDLPDTLFIHYSKLLIYFQK